MHLTVGGPLDRVDRAEVSGHRQHRWRRGGPASSRGFGGNGCGGAPSSGGGRVSGAVAAARAPAAMASCNPAGMGRRAGGRDGCRPSGRTTARTAPAGRHRNGGRAERTERFARPVRTSGSGPGTRPAAPASLLSTTLRWAQGGRNRYNGTRIRSFGMIQEVSMTHPDDSRTPIRLQCDRRRVRVSAAWGSTRVVVEGSP